MSKLTSRLSLHTTKQDDSGNPICSTKPVQCLYVIGVIFFLNAVHDLILRTSEIPVCQNPFLLIIPRLFAGYCFIMCFASRSCPCPTSTNTLVSRSSALNASSCYSPMLSSSSTRAPLPPIYKSILARARFSNSVFTPVVAGLLRCLSCRSTRLSFLSSLQSLPWGLTPPSCCSATSVPQFLL